MPAPWVRPAHAKRSLAEAYQCGLLLVHPVVSLTFEQLRIPHDRGGMKTDKERYIAGGYTEEDGGRTLLW